MYNKVNDKNTEKKENNKSRFKYILEVIFTIFVLTIMYIYLAVSVEKKKQEVSPGTIVVPPEVYTCKIVDGEYWGSEGTKVDEETYKKECEETPVTPQPKPVKPQPNPVVPKTYKCQIVNGEYWGKDSLKVDYATYNLECVPQETYTCEIVNGEYWGKNSTKVSKDEYESECADPTPIEQPNWIIVFENVRVKDGSVDASIPQISDVKTSLTYVVTIAKPGEYYSFDVDIVNKGTMPAKIYSINNTLLTEAQKRYLEYKVTYKNGNNIAIDDTLLVGETKPITVLLKFRDDITSADDLPKVDELLKLTYEIVYVEK